ncbi:hypothetical protein DFJ77DRAFT_473608 [Powellomyces hirtus]|nr:hypothetical protein DFJ77DRAFT_473608 [Powellomyces hirtus]
MGHCGIIDSVSSISIRSVGGFGGIYVWTWCWMTIGMVVVGRVCVLLLLWPRCAIGVPRVSEMRVWLGRDGRGRSHVEVVMQGVVDESLVSGFRGGRGGGFRVSEGSGGRTRRTGGSAGAKSGHAKVSQPASEPLGGFQSQLSEHENAQRGQDNGGPSDSYADDGACGDALVGGIDIIACLGGAAGIGRGGRCRGWWGSGRAGIGPWFCNDNGDGLASFVDRRLGFRSGGHHGGLRLRGWWLSGLCVVVVGGGWCWWWLSGWVLGGSGIVRGGWVCGRCWGVVVASCGGASSTFASGGPLSAVEKLARRRSSLAANAEMHAVGHVFKGTALSVVGEAGGVGSDGDGGEGAEGQHGSGDKSPLHGSVRESEREGIEWECGREKRL